MAHLKDEVSRKLPWIAEKAVSEAGKQWRKKAEEETAAVRTERDRRLKQMQVRALLCLGGVTIAACREERRFGFLGGRRKFPGPGAPSGGFGCFGRESHPQLCFDGKQNVDKAFSTFDGCFACGDACCTRL